MLRPTSSLSPLDRGVRGTAALSADAHINAGSAGIPLSPNALARASSPPRRRDGLNYAAIPASVVSRPAPLVLNVSKMSPYADNPSIGPQTVQSAAGVAPTGSDAAVLAISPSSLTGDGPPSSSTAPTTVKSTSNSNSVETHYTATQAAWAAFSSMSDAQRNNLLRGLLSRCGSKQIDFICMHLKANVAPSAAPADYQPRHSRIRRAGGTGASVAVPSASIPTTSPLQSTFNSLAISPSNNSRGRNPDVQGTGFPKLPDIPKKAEAQHPLPSAASQSSRTPSPELMLAQSSSPPKHRHDQGILDSNIYMRLLNANCDTTMLLRQITNANSDTLRHCITFLNVRMRKLQRVIEVMQQMSSLSGNATKCMELMINTIKEVINAQYVTIYIVDDRTNEIYAKDSTWLPPNKKSVINKIFCGIHVMRGDVINEYNIKSSEHYDERIEEHYTFDLDCLCSAPIFLDSSLRVAGFIEAINKTEGYPYFTAEDEFLVKCIASLLTLMSSHMEFSISLPAFGDGPSVGVEGSSSGKKPDDIKQFINKASQMGQELDLKDLIHIIMDISRDLLSAERCTMFMVDKEKRQLWSSLAQGTSQEIRIPIDKGIAGFVACKGEVLNIPDAYLDDRFNPEVDKKTGFRTRNILCVPMKNAKNDVIGVIQVLNKLPSNIVFNREDELQLCSFSALAAVVVEKSMTIKKLKETLNTVNVDKRHFEALTSAMPHVFITLDALGRLKSIMNPSYFDLSDTALTSMRNANFEYWLGQGNATLIEDLKVTFASGERCSGFNYDLHLFGRMHVVNYDIITLSKDTSDDGLEVALILENMNAERRLRSTLGRTLAPDMATSIIADPKGPLAGVMQKVTVMIVDLVGFTKLASRQSPAETFAILNEYNHIISRHVQEEGGIIERYVGDSVVAAFGIPHSDSKDSSRAVTCAIKIKLAVKEYNEKLVNEIHASVHVGIGISTAMALIGIVGGAKKMEYSIIGDVVTVGHSLEKLTSTYGVSIVCCENTREEVKDRFQLRDLDMICFRRLSKDGVGFDLGYIDASMFVSGATHKSHRDNSSRRGRRGTVPSSAQGSSETADAAEHATLTMNIYEVLSVVGKDLPQDLMTGLICFELGLAEYRARNWQEALLHFKKAIHLTDDAPSMTFLNRCQTAVEHGITLPENWPGVWNFATS